jgi:7-cyano-7-deazaguanine tRNA-ribosyltransferase
MPTVSSSARAISTADGIRLPLPLFLPVYQETFGSIAAEHWRAYKIEGCILNAYFLYKRRELREAFEAGRRIQDHIGFDGLIMTDSGAYQGFTRQLYLDNRTIVRFQDRIGADIISPLDLVTPPGDRRTIAEKKMESTLKRVAQAAREVERGTLAGVQQGGRFRDLRERCTEGLLKIGVEYLALGSLVPFFARNHDLRFIRDVIGDARAQAGPSLPIHVFGAGDPVELPFLVQFGADVFDSSSYAHFAAGGWYMTPAGAVDAVAAIEDDWSCACPTCSSCDGVDAVFADETALRSHNLATIMASMEAIRAAIKDGSLDEFCADVLERHMRLFPESRLAASLD